MELTIKDMLYILVFLPNDGNFKQFNVKKEILCKIEISEKEREEAGLKESRETKRIERDIEKDIPLSVNFTSEELDYLKTSCEKISDKQLPDDMWSSVEKIYNAIQE